MPGMLTRPQSRLQAQAKPRAFKAKAKAEAKATSKKPRPGPGQHRGQYIVCILGPIVIIFINSVFYC